MTTDHYPQPLPEQALIENVTSMPEYGLFQELTEVEPRSLHPVVRKAGRSAVLGLAAASWVFEIGPWNEAFRIDQGVEVLQNTYEAIPVAARVGAITAAVEVTSASLIALGLNSKSGLVEWFKKRKKGKEIVDDAELAAQEEKVYRARDVAKDVGIAMAGGAGVVVVRHNMKYQEGDKPRLKKDVITGVLASVPIVVSTGAIGYISGQSIITGGESDWFGSQIIVDYGTDKRVWFGALAAIYVGGFAKKQIDKIKQRRKPGPELVDDSGDSSLTGQISLFARSGMQLDVEK